MKLVTGLLACGIGRGYCQVQVQLPAVDIKAHKFAFGLGGRIGNRNLDLFVGLLTGGIRIGIRVNICRSIRIGSILFFSGFIQTSQAGTRITIFFLNFGVRFGGRSFFFVGLGGNRRCFRRHFRRHTGKQVFNKTFLNQRFGGFVRQVEVLLSVVFDGHSANLFKQDVHKLQCAFQFQRPSDTDEHRRIGLFIGNVLEVIEFLLIVKFSGIQSEIQIQFFPTDVHFGKLIFAEQEGFATLGDARSNLFIGQELVFDDTVVAFQLVTRLNQASKEGTDIAVLNILLVFVFVQFATESSFGAARFFGTAEFFQTAELFLFSDVVIKENAVGAESHFDSDTHFAFVFGEFPSFKEGRDRHQLLIVGVVNGEIVHFFKIQFGIEVGESFA